MSWAPIDRHAGLLIPRVLVAFAAPQAVTTETPLYVLTELGVRFDKCWVTLRNHSATNVAEAIVDRSESGVVNDELRQKKRVLPLSEATFTFDDEPGREMALMFSLSASGDPEAGYPSVSVSWQLRVRARIG